MGLDMYLLRVEKADYDKAVETKDSKPLHGSWPEKPAEMSAEDWYRDRDNWKSSNEITYWRKANQIHRWFVHNCGGDVDDCQPVLVHPEQLADLYDLCKQVLADHSLAEDLLPTQAGFFFGGTEYDEWYFADLQDTVDALEQSVFKDPKLHTGGFQLIYQASW